MGWGLEEVQPVIVRVQSVRVPHAVSVGKRRSMISLQAHSLPLAARSLTLLLSSFSFLLHGKKWIS